MAWTVVPSLLSLRAEFNAIAPNRDKGADGTIGDSAHTSASDHTPDEQSDVLRDHDADSKNEVHALDIDSSGPWPDGRSFASLVATVIAGERAKWDSETDRCRLKYVIFNRRIYSQNNDFLGEPYRGSDPHTNHAHFSARYDTPAENDTRPWGLIPKPQPQPQPEDDMALSAQDIDKVADAVVAKLQEQLDLDGGAGEVTSGLVKAYRRLWLQYPIAEGRTTYNTIAELDAFLRSQEEPS